MSFSKSPWPILLTKPGVLRDMKTADERVTEYKLRKLAQERVSQEKEYLRCVRELKDSGSMTTSDVRSWKQRLGTASKKLSHLDRQIEKLAQVQMTFNTT